MSNWISLSDPSSGNSVVETTRHGYTIFEVRMGQKARFQLNVDRIRYLQSRRHMIYFVAQGIDSFGEETWLEWNNGPAPMALHEYFNHLNGGSEDYTPDTVRQIGRNYITAFKVGEDGRVDWNTPKYPSYEPKEKGHGVWLEGLYYYPEWNNMGAFIIGVEQPQVVSLFARVRNYANYDPDDNFISGDSGNLQNVKYGETIDLDIETHRIIPGRYSAEVEILHQGTRVYNGKKRLPLENYANPNNPALEYNLEMKESLFVDPAWKQATGHPDGTTQTYTVRFTFSPSDVLENRTEMDGGLAPGSPVVKEFDLEITTTIFDFILPKLGVTPQIISVQEETLEPIEHEECRFTAIEVAVKDQDPVEILRENTEQGALTTNLINPVIPVVAGNGDDKEVTIQLEGVNTEECGEDPSHHNNIFVYDEAVGEWSPEESGDKLVLKPKYEYPEDIISDQLKIFEYIWPSRESLVQDYRITIQACRYNRNIGFRVYPDVQWELALTFALENPLAYTHSGQEEGYIFHQAQEKARKSGYDRYRLSQGGRVPAQYSLSIKTTYTNTSGVKVKNEHALAWSRKVQDALSIFMQLKEMAEKVKNATGGTAKRVPGVGAFSFEVQSPKIGAILGWKCEQAEEGRVATTGTVSFSADPLIGAEFTIDLLAVGSKVHPVVTVIKEGVDIALDLLGGYFILEAKFYGSLKITIDAFQINYNGISVAPEPAKIEGRMGIMFQMELKVEGTIENPIWDVEMQFLANAKAHAYFGGTARLAYDDDGLYADCTGKFSGLLFSAKVEGEINGFTRKVEFESQPIWESDNVPLGKVYLVDGR